MKRGVGIGVVALALLAAPVWAGPKDLGPGGLDSSITAPGAAGGGSAIDKQKAGDFAAMKREVAPGGAIQSAWDAAPADAGVYQGKWSPGSVLRMRVREGMTSTVALPPWDTVSTYTLADRVNFGSRKVPGHAGYVELWTVHPGYDTNLTIVGASGNIYAVYVRGETWNSKNVPDLVTYVRAIQPLGAMAGGEKPPEHEGKDGGAKEGRAKAAVAAAEVLAKQAPEWLRRKNFDPFTVRHDREMSGDESIAPELIFRTDDMTILDFGTKVSDWPAAFEVKDGVDVPVRTRKSKDGRFMGIETVGPLTLRLGEKTVCIKPSA
jgi:type IV secretory pathway VirB9-like protein